MNLHLANRIRRLIAVSGLSAEYSGWVIAGWDDYFSRLSIAEEDQPGAYGDIMRHRASHGQNYITAPDVRATRKQIQTFAAQLARAKGLSFLAARVGVTPRTTRGYLKEMRPRLDAAIRLAKVLALPPDNIVEEFA